VKLSGARKLKLNNVRGKRVMFAKPKPEDNQTNEKSVKVKESSAPSMFAPTPAKNEDEVTKVQPAAPSMFAPSKQ
jgi:hypothetical protein